MFRRVCAGVALLVLAGCTSSGGSADPAPAGSATASAAGPPLAEDFAGATRRTGVIGWLPGAKRLDPKRAVLTGPDFSYGLSGTASLTGRLPAELCSALSVPIDSTVQAGRQLFLAEIDQWFGEEADPVSTAVIADGDRTVELPERPPNALEGTVAVDLPAGAKPVLRVTTAGRTQSIDLSTGRRGRDAIPGFHPVRRARWASNEASTSIRLSGAAVASGSTQERLAIISFQSVEASLLPYAEGRGWARPGRAWLVLEAEAGYSRPAADFTDPDSVTVPPASLTGSAPGAPRIAFAGEPIRIGSATVPSPPSDDSTWVADVPASLRQVTLTFVFRGTIRAAAGPVTWSAYTDPSHTARLTLA